MRGYPSRALRLPSTTLARRTLCTLPQRYDALVARGALRADEQQRTLAAKLEALRHDLAEHSRQTAKYAAAAGAWHAQMAEHRRLVAAKEAQLVEEWRAMPFWRRAYLQLSGHSPPAALLAEAAAAAAAPAADASAPTVMVSPRLRQHHASADHESDGTASACGSCGSPTPCASNK